MNEIKNEALEIVAPEEIANFELDNNISLDEAESIFNRLMASAFDNAVESTETTSSLREASDTESHDGADHTEKKGGSYKDVKTDGEGDLYEVHHMPADSASNLERADGPAIKMEKEDHRQTASCGMSREAREYREKQRELIEQGKFREALQMDIDDIHEKFGDKYDDAIAEMLEYVDQLEEEGRI